MWFLDFFRKRNKPQAAQGRIERRQLPRWQLGCDAAVKWEGQDDFTACRIHDMNFRGFQVWMDRELFLDCRGMSIRFAENMIFDIEISVVWHARVNAKNVYGCRFTRLRDTDKERLYRFVFHNYPRAIKL